MSGRSRIFDHFAGGEPEDARFSRVALAMARSPFWTLTPTYEQPVAVSGEIRGPRQQGESR